MTKIIVDGNSITAKIAHYFSEFASVYPITPSSTMAEAYEELSALKSRNFLGNIPKVMQMQSEAGAVATLHGALSGGLLSTTFTASQGLLLMIPNMFKIAGELLPAVFHVSARAVAGHALSIFGDHSDVMATRQTGFCMLASCNVQECQDMAIISHLCALDSSLPFLHFFDGFRTSHEIQKIDSIDLNEIKELINFNKLHNFKKLALNPEHPHLQGSAQNPDVYFQNKEASNIYYLNAIQSVEKYFEKFAEITGRSYKPFEYYGSKNAESIIISMCSSIDTIKETVDYLNKNGGKYGIINVRLYRPFSVEHLLKVLPASVKRIAVLDRTKENGSLYEPLCLDIISALANKDIKIFGGRYGLGSKEFTPAMVKSVFDNIESQKPINHFTVGITDDITHCSLKVDETFRIENSNINCKFFGLGSDGTIGANKNSIKIIGELTDFYCQGYFEYDSKKSGSLTISHLRFGSNPIKSPYLINNAKLIACHNDSFIAKYNILKDIEENGVFLLNTAKTDIELDKWLPQEIKNVILKKKVKFFAVNAYELARKNGLRGKINSVMQACFFKLVNIQPYENVKELIIKHIKHTYAKKGEDIVKNNICAVEESEHFLREVKLTNNINNSEQKQQIDNDFYNNVMLPISKLEGNKLPVSAFSADGRMPTNTSQFEKRGIAQFLPCWDSENCIQCNRCAFVCPHSCINPVLVSENENTSPEFKTIKATGISGAKYRMQLNPMDCTGCGNCASVCPAKQKAILMKPAEEILEKEKQNYLLSQTIDKIESSIAVNTVKGSQFKKSYFEFSGACAGCGETPYIKLLTQLCGDDLIIANATGCSSIYGGSFPSCPYSVDNNGNGPAWANSLFEDNAEFGLGIALAHKEKRNNLKLFIESNIEKFEICLKNNLKNWICTFDDRILNKPVCNEIKQYLSKKNNLSDVENHIFENLDNLSKKVICIIGGDGWAYDIGFGGLDHVLASGEDVKILVLNTQVYSNTGGQASKATPLGAVARLAYNGKRKSQKELGLYALSYENAYVAQIAMGADYNQCIKAFDEALKFNGTSLIIAYAPCINHGIDMSNVQNEMEKAVKSGFWNLFRYNPSLEKPFILDSKSPSINIKEFLYNEVRFKEIIKSEPEIISEIENEINKRYEKLEKLYKNQ